MIRCLLFGLMLIGFSCVVFSADDAASSQKLSMDQLVGQTQEAFDVLQENYSTRRGTWREMGWWNSANALTAMIRFMKFTDSKEFFPVIENTFQHAQRNSFLNEFYDDEAWWALAWVEAFELTQNKPYLDMAEFIFRDIADSWDDLHGGGVRWKKDSQYKNSIANNLFTLLALRLHAHAPEAKYKNLTYRQWAEKDWAWYKETGMLNKERWVIEDGLRRDGSPNANQHWTYNQGVAIAVFVEFYRLNGDAEFLETAKNIADSTMRHMVTPEGILKERNEPRAGADGSQFKGIFMRHLYTLYEETKDERYKEFVFKNAYEILKNRNGQSGRFGVVWGTKTETADMAAHSSALDCLVAVIGILCDEFPAKNL